MAKIAVIGEGMLELRAYGDGGAWRLGFGGDTLNTAVHLARFGHDVCFVTALGTDPFSEQLIDGWTAEGIDTALIERVPHRNPGLYAITTDLDGERGFTYWRGESAARAMFDSPPGIATALAAFDLLFYSLISLAVLPDIGRARLIAISDQFRSSGGKVAFDGNYRPGLWQSASQARLWRDRALSTCDIGLPTLEDEIALQGAHCPNAHGLDPQGAALRWRSHGVEEVAVKVGRDGCYLDDRQILPPKQLMPVDTSGAGDAFNAGYLNGRLSGQKPSHAAMAGHVLAGWTILQRGAIPARIHDAPYGIINDMHRQA